MKLGFLDGFDKIKVCVAYNYNGERIDYMPSNMDNVEAIYEEIDGCAYRDWETDRNSVV